MNSATNVQPAAGHGNGSVRTQNQPEWSSPESSVQSSSSSSKLLLLEEDASPAPGLGRLGHLDHLGHQDRVNVAVAAPVVVAAVALALVAQPS